MILAGKILAILSVGLIFLAYANFLPASLRNADIPDYVKNHFVREVVFGLTLAVLAIGSIYLWTPGDSLLWPALLGTVVVIPFWIAWAFGWSTGGLSDIWGGAINARGAYMLHVPQVALFFIGMALLFFAARNAAE